jgi:hypothetical protein
MISFRLTNEEYVRLHRLSISCGLRNVSELVRTALDHMVSQELGPEQPGSLPEINQRVENLESCLADVISTVRKQHHKNDGG